MMESVMRRAGIALTILGLCVSSPALAAQPEQTDAVGSDIDTQIDPDDAIVVTGSRLPDKKINRYIYDMLRPQAVGQQGQYARLAEPFCPSVLGFSKKAESVIEARMRKVAAAAGIEVDEKSDCRPNVHLVRVESGRETIRFLRRNKARGAFGNTPIHQRDTIERRSGPVFSWQQTFSYGADSRQIIDPNPINGGAFDPAALGINFIYDNPRLRMGAEAGFRHATVLVERDALDDVSAIQLADFAVMRGLVPAREDEFRQGARTADSILNLFDPSVKTDARLPSLGRMDLALLTSLYAAPDNVNANRQRGQMVKTFRAVLAQVD